MEYILVLLIVALLNGAIAYIDGLMEGIIPLTLYAEQYMSTLAGVDLFQSLFDIVFGFGVSLIVLKFLKKGFETYVLWSDGDADEEPIAILTNFFKAMAVAICFPTMYDWLATIVEEMSNKMLEAIGLATAYDWAGWVSGISSMGLVTAIFGVACMILAVRTPKFLQDFLITTGGGGGGAIVNNAYHSVRLVQMVKGMGK